MNPILAEIYRAIVVSAHFACVHVTAIKMDDYMITLECDHKHAYMIADFEPQPRIWRLVRTNQGLVAVLGGRHG